MTNYLNFALIVIAYLLGSICSAVVVCKIFNLSDPRTEGSNNPGATNVLRLHGKKYAAMVLIADMLKGTIAVIIGHLFDAPAPILGWIGFAAVFGHVFPVYFKFKGGKGVATALGVYFGIHLLLGLLCLGVWLITAKVKKFSSLASLVTMIIAPIAAVSITRSGELMIPLLAISFLVIIKHRTNIERLIQGKESTLKF